MAEVDKYLRHTKQVGDCLEWTRALNSDGYPRAFVNGNSNGKVHREVFFLCNGFYPEVVRHSCDNPRCINPKHLLEGNQLQNVEDRISRGRSHNHVSEELRQQILDLRERGLKYKEIASLMSVSFKRVDYILNGGRKKG